MENINFFKGETFLNISDRLVWHMILKISVSSETYCLNFAKNVKELSRSSKCSLPFLSKKKFNVYPNIKLH